MGSEVLITQLSQEVDLSYEITEKAALVLTGG